MLHIYIYIHILQIVLCCEVAWLYILPFSLVLVRYTLYTNELLFVWVCKFVNVFVYKRVSQCVCVFCKGSRTQWSRRNFNLYTLLGYTPTKGHNSAFEEQQNCSLQYSANPSAYRLQVSHAWPRTRVWLQNKSPKTGELAKQGIPLNIQYI